MAGTELQSEGVPRFRVKTIRAADSSLENALESAFQINSLQDGAIVYVTEDDFTYQWYPDSLATPTTQQVVIPLGQGTLIPGRWLMVLASSVQQYARLHVPASFGGGSIEPIIICNQTVAIPTGTMGSLTIPESVRQTNYSSWFSLDPSDIGPFTYNGPDGPIFLFSWLIGIRLLADPNCEIFAGIQVPGQSVPRGIDSVLLTGSAGDQFYLSGSAPLAVVAGPIPLWLGMRPIGGGPNIDLSEIGYTEITLTMSYLGLRNI